ncbi:MAG: co-chaperone GroES [Halanaerobiaceae bacterium]
MKIKPLNDKVAVKYVEVEEEEKTDAGIVLPDTAKKDEKPQQGEVIAVGSNCYSESGDDKVEVGDVVVFDKFAGTEITVDDEDYIIVKFEDILAVVE